MSARGPRPLGLLAVMAAILAFSISSSIVKWSGTSGSVVAFWRMWGAIVAWWIIVVTQHRRTGQPLPGRDTWVRALPCGLLFGANLAIFFTAVTRTSIAHAEFIGSLTPLVLLPAGAVLFHEHPNWRALSFGSLSIVGVFIVLAFGPPGGTATVGGDLLVVLAVASWAGYLLLTKRAARGVSVVDFLACVMPIGLLTCAPIAVSLAGDELWPVSGKGWVAVASLTLLTGLAAHGFLIFAQHRIPIATIGIMQSGQPALAVFWAWLILGESIRPAQVPGMALVIVGLALFTVASQRRPPLMSEASAPPLEEPAH